MRNFASRGGLIRVQEGSAVSRNTLPARRPGAFEVTAEDGRPVFSRLGSRYFPARTELVERVRRALPGGAKAASGFFGWRA